MKRSLGKEKLRLVRCLVVTVETSMSSTSEMKVYDVNNYTTDSFNFEMYQHLGKDVGLAPRHNFTQCKTI